jgi:hypothetical protein
MLNAMCLAGIFGPLLAIIGLWMLLYNDNMMKVWSSFKSTPAAFYLSGCANLLIGLVIVSQYNSWMMGLAFLVTLLGWVMIIRGILALFMPQLLVKVMSNASWAKTRGIIVFIWGLLLCWFAFYM